MAQDSSFPEIQANSGNKSTYHRDPNATDMTEPKKIRTGNSGGDWNIKGRILITDANGVVRMVLGFDPQGF